MKIYRPATVLVGALFVLLGGLTRIATPHEVYDGNANLVDAHGTIGTKVKYYDSTVEITRMKLAKSILKADADDDDKPIETNGVYVALEWDTVRGTRKPDGLTETLVADGGTVYTAVGGDLAGSIDFGAPGFGKTGALVFEVNPADVKGLELRLVPMMIYNVLWPIVTVDLGIPSEDIAQQLVDGAEAQYAVQGNVDRVVQ